MQGKFSSKAKEEVQRCDETIKKVGSEKAMEERETMGEKNEGIKEGAGERKREIVV